MASRPVIDRLPSVIRSITEQRSRRAPTRERILAAALELFAERGYRGTSIGEIEAAAGLSPRSGAPLQALPEQGGAVRRGAVGADRGDRLVQRPARADAARRPARGAHPDRALGPRGARPRAPAGPGGDARRRPRPRARRALPRDDRRAAGSSSRSAACERYAAERGAELADPEALGEVICASLVGFSLQQTMFGERRRRGRTTNASSPPGSTPASRSSTTSKGATPMPEP